MRILMGGVLTMVGVGLARQVTYRRRARPAEWLAIVVFVWSQIDLMATIHLGETDRSFWPLFGALINIVTLLGLGLGVLWVTRKILPDWSRTIVLGGMAYLAMGEDNYTRVFAPLPMIVDVLPNLLAPRDGFGPGAGPFLHHQLCDLAAVIPYGLLFGVPAMACLMERIQRRSWAWTEWAALSVAVLIGVVSSLKYRGEITQFSGLWLAERGLLLGWFVGIGLVSRLIVVKFASRFWRWLDGERVQVASSSLASDASIR